MSRPRASLSILGASATFAVARVGVALPEYGLSATYIVTRHGIARPPIEGELLAPFFLRAALAACVGAPLAGPAGRSRRTRATLAASTGHAQFVAGACLLGPAVIASA